MGVAVLGVGLAMLAERGARRFLPLVAFLRLSMAFPDHAPSRFAVAMRTGTTRQLERRIEEIRSVGLVGVPEEQFGSIVLELAAALSVHDRLTRGHGERVRAYTDLIGEEMGLGQNDLEKLRWASLLHDVGKLFVPSEILNKPGRLTAEEFEIIKQHPVHGMRLVAPLQDWLGPWALAVSQHHERWDGGGYPFGLSGTDIHLGARMVAVADAFDVMTSARSYKAPMKVSDARAELARCAGSQFDPAVVRAFLSVGLGHMHHLSGPLGILLHLGTLGGAQLLPQSAPMLSSLVAASAMTVVGLAPTMDAHSLEDPPPVLAFVDDAIVVEAAMDEDPATTVIGLDEGAGPHASATGPPVDANGAPPEAASATGDGSVAGPAPSVGTSGRPDAGSTPPTSTTTPHSGSGAAPASTTTTVPPGTRSDPGTPPSSLPTNLPLTGSIVVDEDGEGTWSVNGTGSAPTLDIVSGPAHGDVSTQAGLLALDEPDPSRGVDTRAVQSARWSAVVVYRPDAQFNGADSVVVRSCRGQSCVTATLSVTVSSRNDGPVVQARSITRSVCGLLAPAEMLAGVGDVDGDLVSLVSARRSDGQPLATSNLGFLGLGPEVVTVTVADAAGLQASGPMTIVVTPPEPLWDGLVLDGVGPSLPTCSPAVTSVTWRVDGDEIGTTSSTPFDMRSAAADWTGVVDDLADPGSHTIVAGVRLADGSTIDVAHSLTVVAGNSGNGNGGNSGSGNSGNGNGGNSGSGSGGNSGSGNGGNSADSETLDRNSGNSNGNSNGGNSGNGNNGQGSADLAGRFDQPI